MTDGESSESLLVVCSFILAIILYVIAMIRGPRLGIVNKNIYFDKKQLPNYFILLITVALISILFGYIFAGQFLLSLGFAGLNALIAAIMGLQLFLFRRKVDKE